MKCKLISFLEEELRVVSIRTEKFLENGLSCNFKDIDLLIPNLDLIKQYLKNNLISEKKP